MDVVDGESPFGVKSDRCGLLSILFTDEDSDEDTPGREAFKDEEPALPPGMKCLEELYDDDHSDVDDDGDLAVIGKKRRYAETARMFKLRRSLDQLDCFHQQKERDVLKAREELKVCRQNIESLVEHRDDLENEIEQQRAADNSVAVFHLRAQHKHLCQKLMIEEDLEGHISTGLRQQELLLSEVEVELSRFSSLRQEVQEEERVFQALKSQKAATRLQRERKTSQNLQLKMQHLRDKQAAVLKKEEADYRKKIEEDWARRKTAVKYLKETIKRMHQQEAENEQQSRELLEKRMQAVKSLKTNIAANKESLRVQQSRAKANAQKKEQRQRQLRESLDAQGINSIKHMYQQKQREEIKQKQAEFEERQKSKKDEIVAKILQEEQLVKSRKRQQALLPKLSTADKFPSLGRARGKLYLEPIPPSAAKERATVSRQFSEFEERQKSKREEIVPKILQEEQLVKSRKLPKLSTADNFPSLGRARGKLNLEPIPPSAAKERATVQSRQFSEFEERQKSKREEIVPKILQEEQLVKSRKLPKLSTADNFPSLGRARGKLNLEPIPPSAAKERATVQSRQFSEFEERQKSKREEIVPKILQEEQLVKSRKLPKLSTADNFPSLGRARGKLNLEPIPPSAAKERATVQLRQFSDLSSSPSASFDVEDLEETVHQEVDLQSLADSLAEPEFCGLWDQDYKKLLNVKTPLVLTKVNQKATATTSGKLNVPAKKVHGKELKGPPFTSKPEVILFKDFEVGIMYKMRITLTNISFVTNHCKLLGVSAKLKDFLSVNFEPPGSLAPGMSCGMQAVFQPVINEDLEGEVQFASVLGPFSVPVRCTIKRCDLEVDSRFIDFGSHVVGQTISWTITLTNKGALATLFSLDTSTRTVETSHAQMAPKQESQELSEASQQEHPESEASASSPEVIPETCVSTDEHLQMDQSHSESGDISLGNVSKGEIGPFESLKLEVVFTPTIPGEAKLDFHIKFSDLTSKPIPIQVRGVAVSFPVSVVRPSMDMKICMFDRNYQDIILVQSRASTALKLTFEVCPEMRRHMEILTKTDFIQAQSSFKALLKFHPRFFRNTHRDKVDLSVSIRATEIAQLFQSSLSRDAKRLFDSDTGVLEVPLAVQVADQVTLVHFTVHAVVTTSDLQFDRAEVDFGFCSIYYPVMRSVRLTNLSLQSQEFVFLDVPEFIQLQPNDGFGTLFPQETLEIYLIFSANEAKEYSFQMRCKSEVNRDFPLSCRAVGVRPPLQLSQPLVQFGDTAVGDCSTAVLFLLDLQTAHNWSKQPISPVVTPRLFSFYLPKDSEVSVYPPTGGLLPGERCLVRAMFRPRLSDQDIKEEALRLQRAKSPLVKELERNRHAEQETKNEVPVETDESSKTSDGPKTDQLTESPDPANIQPGSEQYSEARNSLLYSVSPRYKEYKVPCFVSDGGPPEDDPQAQPSWSTFNTLYLKLQCPAVRPPLVVVSDSGKHSVDFHQVAVGQRVIKRFTVQNISNETLDLRSSLLDRYGPFCLLNALRSIKPGGKHTLVLAFCPSQEKKYCETLEVFCQKMTLEMTVCGEGVVLVVTFSHPGGLLDFGYVLEKQSPSHVLKLQNSSAVAVGFQVLLASLDPSRPQGGADLVDVLLRTYGSQVQPTVGTQNYSGLCVFRVAPGGGSLAPGQSLDVTVTFQPDHPSVNYSDRLTVELMNKSELCVVDLKGAVSSHNMYLFGGDQLTVPIESLLPPLITSRPQLTESELEEKPTIPVLLTMRASYSAGVVSPGVRELQVGCIRSTQSTEKSGEFFWDNVASLQQLGFSVEPSQGTVESGCKCTITVTWTPQKGYKPHEVVETCLPLTLKGDETNVYRVTMMAMVSTTAYV